MATRSPGYNRLGLSIILSSLSPAITGDFFFLPLYPIPPLSATKSPALSCPSDCAKRERPSLFSDFILLPACRAKRESFSLHTFFFGNLSSQVQQQIGKDFRGGVPVEAFARTMIQLFCKLGQSLCRKRNLIGVFGNVLPQQTVDLLV